MGEFHQNAVPPSPMATLQAAANRFFQFAVPPGWRVAEEGQFAVVLVAPDQCALTVMTGNCGLPAGSNPMQYLQGKLAAFRYADLRMGQPRPARPMNGYTGAWEVDYVYSVNGVPCQGVAVCHVRGGYDTCDMVMTCAASVATQWPSYAAWLPRVPEQAAATNSGAFGAAGIAQQNLANSIAYGQQAAAYREWSANTWDQVTQQRQASQDRQNFEFRQNLGGSTRYDNPYDRRSVDLPAGNAVYWVNPQTGQIVGSPNPSFDPRSPTDSNWQPMNPTRPPG